MDIGTFVRDRRDAAGLTQWDLAVRSGLSQTMVSAIEGGRRRPSLDTIEQVLSALGLQLRLETEPLLADVDAAIEAALARPPAERIDARGLNGPMLLQGLAPAGPVVEGLAGAALHGAPVPLTHLDVAVASSSVGVLTEVIMRRMFAERWSDQWRQWGPADRDPRRPGSPRWRTISGEFRVRVVEQLPASVVVMVGDLPVAVRPLHEIEGDDPETRRVLARVRERLGGGAVRTA